MSDAAGSQGWSVRSPVPYSALFPGYAFERTFTVTETHLLLASTLFGDAVPVHVDESFARHSMFGTRIAPGPVISGFLAVSIGMHFAGTALAYLEQVERFKRPVLVNDTVTTRWAVTELHPKARYDGGVVTMEARCTNQSDEVVLEASGVVIVGNHVPSPQTP